ncbi:MAG: hypothetical protein Q9191_004192 [Dirinaria sp. TL-2023a]
MATHADGRPKAINDRCVFRTVREQISKQYESQKRYQPEQRRQALCENDTVITLPRCKDLSSTNAIEDYIALRFFPIALTSTSFYQGRHFYEQIVTLWQPDKDLALRINVSVESRMRFHYGVHSLGDLFDIPEDPDHPHYQLRKAIFTLKRDLEAEIQEVLSHEAEKKRMQHRQDAQKKREKCVPKESTVLRSTTGKKPVDMLGKAAWVEKQHTREQQRPKPSKAAQSAVTKASTGDTTFLASERLSEDEWELVEAVEEESSWNMEDMESTDDYGDVRSTSLCM